VDFQRARTHLRPAADQQEHARQGGDRGLVPGLVPRHRA
jgi:hypothetical protein